MKPHCLLVALLGLATLCAPPAWAQVINDNFNSNSLDSRLWEVLAPPPTSSVTVTPTNQRLEVTMSSGTGGGGIISKCSLAADFDVQVDYILLNWPANNNHSVRLGAYDLGGVGVLRFSGLSPSPELYELGPGSTAHTVTADTSGQFRLVRTGSTLSGFFRMGSSWTFLGSETVSTVPTRLNLDLGTNGTFAPGGVLIAFDNFQVNGGTISCPVPSNIGVTSSTNPVLTVSEPISTANGDYYYQHTDFAIPGRGMPLVFQRGYNSLDLYSGPLGTNWTHSYNIFLAASSTSAVIKWGDGHGESFALSGSNYVPQPGVFSTLVKNPDATFTLTEKNQTKYAFSAGGKLTTIQDKNGNTILLIYDGSGNLIRVIDAVGRALNLSYDTTNRIAQITDSSSRSVSFQYDTNNNLIQATDPAGGITTFTYDSNHRFISITLPNSQVLLQNTYDGTGRVISQTGGRGFSATLAYGAPNPGDTTITDARGNKTIHTYDSSLRIIKIKDSLSGSTTFTYDANNDRTAITNQNTKTTTFAYDARGNITGITDPLGHAVTFSYDGKNNLLTATNPKGKTTTFSYDGNGNLRTIQDALTNTATFGYDGFGELISKTDARGNATTYIYDLLGNLTRITDAVSHSTALAYDGIGRLASITDPNGHTATATYDALSRLVKITDPLRNQTKFAYDAVGNLLRTTDANGNETNYLYDATNNLVRVTDALSHVTRYAYDGNNNRTSFTNAKGNATSYAYDTLNRLSRITDPLSFVTSYSYDAVGNVVAITDAKGQTNQFAYDALSRLMAISYADGKNISYSYDANGNRISMLDSHGTTLYAYDALDRLTSATHPGAKVVTYAYDAVGNRQSIRYPDGKIVSYSFDAANRLAAVTDWLGRNTTYAYDTASNLISTLYPNHAALAFSYDDANRLTEVRNSFRKGEDDDDQSPIARFRYVLDPVGNRTQVTDGGGKVTRYRYDALYELTSVSATVDEQPGESDDANSVTRFSYDTVGNRVRLIASGSSITYSYDAGDRLLSADTSNFTYDGNGNQTSVTRTSTAQPILYRYDAANRLIAVNGGSRASSFAYDGDGTRISQTVGAGTYNYLNDVATALPVVLQESGPDGNISYAYGHGLISGTSPKLDFFYHYDGLGTVIALTNASGKPRAAYLYDAWGNSLLTAPNFVGTKNKFRFTGEALDPGTELYYLRARYYDSSTGRFLSRDPLHGAPRTPLMRNRYLYALSNPVRFRDPGGLTARDTATAPQGTPTALDFLLPNTVLNPQVAAQGFGTPFCTGQLDCEDYFLSGLGLLFEGPVGIGLSLTAFGVEVRRDSADPNAWSKWASLIVDAGGLAVGFCGEVNPYCKAAELALFAVDTISRIPTAPDVLPITTPSIAVPVNLPRIQ